MRVLYPLVLRVNTAIEYRRLQRRASYESRNTLFKRSGCGRGFAFKRRGTTRLSSLPTGTFIETREILPLPYSSSSFHGLPPKKRTLRTFGVGEVVTGEFISRKRKRMVNGFQSIRYHWKQGRFTSEKVCSIHIYEAPTRVPSRSHFFKSFNRLNEVQSFSLPAFIPVFLIPGDRVLKRRFS